MKKNKVNYKNLLPYLSNLDDSEYASLWECYKEESIFKKFIHSLTKQVDCLLFRMKIYLINFRRSKL